VFQRCCCHTQAVLPPSGRSCPLLMRLRRTAPQPLPLDPQLFFKDHVTIAKRYLGSWFLFDLVAALPWNLVREALCRTRPHHAPQTIQTIQTHVVQNATPMSRACPFARLLLAADGRGPLELLCERAIAMWRSRLMAGSGMRTGAVPAWLCHPEPSHARACNALAVPRKVAPPASAGAPPAPLSACQGASWECAAA
jgi:hypothetical protein